MKERVIKQRVQGSPAVDGAGVHLVRVLGGSTVYDFDPFLMLDSFDSENPADYIKGFPTHPHRGIETITYLVQGQIDHQDSLGNKGSILPGQSQWMTAGRGILHQEMPQPSARMLGLQFWLNLPRAEKMAPPHYFDITQDMVGVFTEPGAVVKVIAGTYKTAKGVTPPHIQASLYDVALTAGASVSIPAPEEETAFVFTLEGAGTVCGGAIPAKTAVLLKDGDTVTVTASEGDMRLIFAMAKPLGEPIAWGGPIVMNTREELDKAFTQLRNGSFLE